MELPKGNSVLTGIDVTGGPVNTTLVVLISLSKSLPLVFLDCLSHLGSQGIAIVAWPPNDLLGLATVVPPQVQVRGLSVPVLSHGEARHLLGRWGSLEGGHGPLLHSTLDTPGNQVFLELPLGLDELSLQGQDLLLLRGTGAPKPLSQTLLAWLAGVAPDIKEVLLSHGFGVLLVLSTTVPVHVEVRLVPLGTLVADHGVVFRRPGELCNWELP
mmetsp:Transcript_49178/g.76735  ORF Transcript_49178/g.76735 Transcript_49178/m.76735 type:complete len:214 (-) Transcript_49178:38-679(-)